MDTRGNSAMGGNTLTDMTAAEARDIEGKFGKIEAREDKQNYPHLLYGEIKKVDSYYLLFESTGDELVLFNLRKVKSFTPIFKRKRLVRIPKKFCFKANKM